jgi:hypothetical protein
MNVDDLSWEYQPLENPDWDYSRNLFTVIKRPQATWSQSVFSAKCDNLLAPNRDYRYQGLCCFSGKEYWKFLDAVFFGIRGVNLEPRKVTAHPWKHVYSYSGDGTEVDVSYFLNRDEKEGILGKVVFDVKSSFIKELTIKPLIDIRNAVHDSSPWTHEISAKKDCMTAKNFGNEISLYVKGSNVLVKKDITDWRYKLGSGYRESRDGVRFVSEWGKPLFAGEIQKTINKRGSVTLLIGCNRKISDFDETQEIHHLNPIIKRFKASNEILARILSLESFGIYDENKTISEAGDFWFRQIWLRDLLESTINNFNTISKIDPKRIHGIIDWCLKNQDYRTGRFYNFKGNTESLDASLLFFILAEKYLEKHSDKHMEKRISESYDLLIKRFLFHHGSEYPEIKNSMLYCLPWHSWTDSRVNIDGKMFPTRIPFEWSSEYAGQRVLLPEINAMFIRFLGFGEKLGKETKDMYEKAKDAYKKVFSNGDFLCSVVMDSKKDATESSMALVSSVLLHDIVFDKSDLERMWPSIERLLVRKKSKAFGILCRNYKDRTYYNDYQYHGAVCWPRDTPYLIRYLKLTGRNEMAKEVLESNLEHQMKEGAIAYSGELFSLPEGNNPSPTENSQDPVPVKNPIQLWSSFCDEYISD